jgi:hypothetical protein
MHDVVLDNNDTAAAKPDKHITRVVARVDLGLKGVPDCFLPSPHRSLYLNNNSQLSALPADLFSGLSSLT